MKNKVATSNTIIKGRKETELVGNRVDSCPPNRHGLEEEKRTSYTAPEVVAIFITLV